MIDVQAAKSDVPRHGQLVDEPIVVAYFLCALGYLALSMVAGLLMALQLVHWNPLNGMELLSPGRWRMVHTNVIAYGFLANAFLGALHWAVPRLMLKPVLDRRLSWFIFVAWQVVVLATAVGIVLGPTLQAHVASLGNLPFSLGARASNGAKRRSGSIRWRWSGCCWWRSTSWRRSCVRAGRCTSRCGTSWPPSCGRF